MVGMSREIRRDPITGEHVILSADRVVERNPGSGSPAPSEPCPFCPGHEAHTRPTIAAIERDGRWVARAFANRWPALVVEETARSTLKGPYESIAAVGAHEVVVEAPEHLPLHRLPVERTRDALALATQRIRDLRRDSRLAVLHWFRNQGAGAGASQPHPHAQLVGTPFVPDRVRMMMVRAKQYQDTHGQRLLPAIVDVERREARRMLLDGPRIVAFCPFAPRHPFEVWLVPTAATGTFGDADGAQLDALADAMWQVTRALAAVHGEVPLTSLALGGPDHEDTGPLGWHLRVFPRLVGRAGLEESTNTTVHSVFPEVAAELLRKALAGASP
jgi:UDPglucose--hexose-1-phosphate uridylyltransferase